MLRGDYGQIAIRAGANVPDASVLHSREHNTCGVRPGATVADLCVVHGATWPGSRRYSRAGLSGEPPGESSGTCPAGVSAPLS